MIRQINNKESKGK
jgi:hypothetical protein